MPPINASVTNQQITASVGETQIDVSVSGGVGPTGAQGAPGATDYTQLTNVPASFPPSAHGHTIAEVSGLSVALDGKQAAGSYAASVHTHTAAQITDFAAAVVAAAPPTTNASLLTSGTLDAARLPGSVVFTTDARLSDARTPTAHTHDDRYYTETEVDTLLAGKQATGSYVLTTDARLSDARQPLTHQHTAAQISDFTAAVIAAAPPTVDASLLTQGTIPDARISSAIARTSDITTAVANVVNAAPAALDTLNELAAALGNDASFATTVTNSLAGKANVSHTHTVSAITDAGTAATRNVPATGNAGATEVVLGSDTRLTDSRTPTGHAHGNINNLGQMSAASTLDPTAVGGPAVFGALAGTIGRGQFGTSAGTVCQGNDSRLSDARTPTAHTQAWTTITSTPTSLSGYGITDAVASSDARLTDARTPLAHNQAWSTITSTPTTLAGYGITDGATQSHTHSASQVTDFASAVAAAAPAEVLDFLTAAQFPATGLASKIYVATDHSRAYQWTGSQYAEIGPAGAFLPVHSHAASEITSGVLDAARLPLATNAQALAGTNAATVLTPQAMHLSRRGSGRARFFELFTDFAMDLSGNLPGSDGFIFGNQSSGIGATMNLFSNTSDSFTTPTAGILTVTTGTTSTGRGGFDSFQSRPHRADTGTTTFETLIYLPLLASATEDYVLRIGYVRGSGIDMQCVCFEYDRAASANWRCVTGNEGNFTRSTTSVAVTETRWIKLAATWTSASAAFFINDVQVATNTQFIRPQTLWLGGHIIKTAGTTARTMLVDYFYARHDFTNERTFT